MFRGNPIKIVFALTNVLMTVPLRPGATLKALTLKNATIYPRAKATNV